MAPLNASPTGDQEVAGSTHAGSATFFSEDWSWGGPGGAWGVWREGDGGI